MLKAEPELAAGYLCTLFKHILENMKVPDDWKKAMTATILGESPYSQYHVRFSVEWSLNVLRKELTQS